uniref:Uncharacterized protein n=1 Tax=Romanomermis culicivorax TaxID=13658 RepID=A0A915JFB5_ROMCU
MGISSATVPGFTNSEVEKSWDFCRQQSATIGGNKRQSAAVAEFNPICNIDIWYDQKAKSNHSVRILKARRQLRDRIRHHI